MEFGAGATADESVASVLGRCMEESGLAVRVHNYFPPPSTGFVLNLASDDEVVARASMNLCREALSLCGELGIPYYSVHAGFCVHCTPADLGRGLAELPRIEHRHEPVSCTCGQCGRKRQSRSARTSAPGIWLFPPTP